MFVVDFAVALASGDTPPQEVIGTGPAVVLGITRLAIGIVMLVQCFTIKDILEDHLAADDERSRIFSFERVQLSGLMTFFFQIFYLQHAINRYIVDAQERAV